MRTILYPYRKLGRRNGVPIVSSAGIQNLRFKNPVPAAQGFLFFQAMLFYRLKTKFCKKSLANYVKMMYNIFMLICLT